MSEVKDPLEAVKREHGRVIVARIGDDTLAFKRLNRAKITDMKKLIGNKPELAVEISINACEFCCVYGKEKFKELSDMYPLVFCGNDDSPGVIDALMDLARGGGTASIQVE